MDTRGFRYALTRQIKYALCLDMCVIVKINIRSHGHRTPTFNYYVSFELFDEDNIEGKKWHRG